MRWTFLFDPHHLGLHIRHNIKSGLLYPLIFTTTIYVHPLFFPPLLSLTHILCTRLPR
ncbi:hypothetical protein P154DRAFT_350202 [Amniculicola lignicola CBS 123094]|uniref:Uncharacterized protein n=1 Tax=Amniculicola lignicola CBS 123094 TaxID=1392246 RepID=A0A6A5VZN7_9PLEO|nr:hypothetical protein P154DRAFT_350202 [Amniculicola lignicola CBS 123094]